MTCYDACVATSPSPPKQRGFRQVYRAYRPVLIALVVILMFSLAGLASLAWVRYKLSLSVNQAAIIVVVLLVAAGLIIGLNTRVPASEKKARERVKQAENEFVTNLTLPALWELTHSRIDLYHQIATSQARRSFAAAQVASAAGFILLFIFAYSAAHLKSPANAITTGALGAVSAALAGYIGRTFVRSQKMLPDTCVPILINRWSSRSFSRLNVC